MRKVIFEDVTENLPKHERQQLKDSRLANYKQDKQKENQAQPYHSLIAKNQRGTENLKSRVLLQSNNNNAYY